MSDRHGAAQTFAEKVFFRFIDSLEFDRNRIWVPHFDVSVSRASFATDNGYYEQGFVFDIDYIPSVGSVRVVIPVKYVELGRWETHIIKVVRIAPHSSAETSYYLVSFGARGFVLESEVNHRRDREQFEDAIKLFKDIHG